MEKICCHHESSTKEIHAGWERQSEFWVNYPFKKSFNKQEEGKAGVKTV